MILQELFDKYKNLNRNDILSTVNKLGISIDDRKKLIRLIECHIEIEVNVDPIAKCIADIASITINNLNADEWVGKTIGKHKITRVLNSGATGVVFLGEKGGDYVQKAAVKLINPHLTHIIGEETVLNEAQLMASLNHCGIAKIYDSGRLTGGIIYFIIEFVEGKQLTEMIEHKLDIKQVLQISIDLCSAIAHAHDLQITHKDIKPDNILISKDYKVKVIDFGLSQFQQQSNTDFHALSKEYASPEQISNKAVSSRTDIFSIGCCIFEAITGEKYTTMVSSIGNDLIRTNKGTLVDFVSKRHELRAKFRSRTSLLEVSSIIEKAVHENAAERYNTVDALAHDLERVTQRYPVKAFKPKSIPAYHFLKFIHRNPVIFAMGSILICSLIWFTAATKNQLTDLKNEQRKVHQVLDHFKDLLVNADPRERLGAPISFEDVLVRELHKIETASDSNKAHSVKYELLMTIGEGLLGHGKGVDAEKAFVRAIETAKLAFGDDSIEVVAATVKLSNAYAQNVYYEEIETLIEPYFTHIFVEEFSHIEFARMFIVFNKMNSRFFNDSYSNVRFEPPITTLRKIATTYINQLQPIEVIDLQLTILKSTFYDLTGDFASPTSHVSELDIMTNRIPIIKSIIPDLDKLILLARNNDNTQFMLPELISWRARLSYEVKDYIASNSYYVEALAMGTAFFDEDDFRLSIIYIYGAIIFRYFDTSKALLYAGKSLEIDFNSLKNDLGEYLDNMTIFLDFLYLDGEFKRASEEVVNALSIANKIGEEKLTLENKYSIETVLETYLLYSHTSTNLIKPKELYGLISNYNRCSLSDDRIKSYCEIVDYIFSGVVETNNLQEKLNHVLSTEIIKGKRDHEIIYLTMLFLQQTGDYEQSWNYIPLLVKHIDWSDLEKSNSLEYMTYLTFIGLTNLRTGHTTEAKKYFLQAQSILTKHDNKESAHIAIVYTSLAELAFLDNDIAKTKEYIALTTLSASIHFDDNSIISARLNTLQNKIDVLKN